MLNFCRLFHIIKFNSSFVLTQNCVERMFKFACLHFFCLTNVKMGNNLHVLELSPHLLIMSYMFKYIFFCVSFNSYFHCLSARFTLESSNEFEGKGLSKISKSHKSPSQLLRLNPPPQLPYPPLWQFVMDDVITPLL